ncbi:MAG: tail fiber domain-containing protein [Bacteroidales bacterium]
MKTKCTLRLTVIIILSFFFVTSFGQAPQGFNYQAVARQNNTLLSNSMLEVEVTFHRESPGGSAVYSEMHQSGTNDLGLFSIVIGEGSPVQGTFSDVDWQFGSWYLSIRIKPDGGGDFVSAGAVKLQSVPYALYAESTPDQDSDPTNEIQDLELNDNTLTITNNPEATGVDLSPFQGTNTDNQTLSIEGAQLVITGGNSVDLGTFNESTVGWSRDGNNVVYLSGNVGIGTVVPEGRFSVQGVDEGEEEPLFMVTRKDGYPVFAVYEHGVYAYTDTAQSGKGLKGGFAVGGYKKEAKGMGEEYMRVTADSIRFYIHEDPEGQKGLKGGFAVGGYQVPGKGPLVGKEFLRVTPDSVRVYIDDDPDGKGLKGGFAVGGYKKEAKGGADYFNISGKNLAETIAGENRVVWYPLKNAFLAGRVLVEDPVNVGENSMAMGYEPKSSGDYSQAFGYRSQALGTYSTAMGNQASAESINSFAFGEGATAKNNESYAFGRGAMAEGLRSFAFGSAGIDSLGQLTGVAYAKGDYSFAIGQGSVAEGLGSVSIGLGNTSLGRYSLAMGYKTSSNGFGSTASGRETASNGSYSTAMGYQTAANGQSSVAMGLFTEARGDESFAMGVITEARGDNSFAAGTRSLAQGKNSIAMGNYLIASAGHEVVFGQYNAYYGANDPIGWNLSDRLFSVGNGTGEASRKNAFTIFKSGDIAIGNITPTQNLDIQGRIRIRGGYPFSGGILTSDANGVGTWSTLAITNTTGTLPVNRGGTGRTSFTAHKIMVGADGGQGILQPSQLHWDFFNNRLGIATTNPQEIFEVNGNIRLSSGANRHIIFPDRYRSLFIGGKVGEQSAYAIHFITDNGSNIGLERLSIVGQSVGIGTTNPQGKLHVWDNTSNIGTVRSESTYSGTSAHYAGAFIANSGSAGTGCYAAGSAADFFAGGPGTNYASSSSIRWKHNIREIDDALSKLIGIRGVYFTWDPEHGGSHDVGFIAEEVETILPEIVYKDPTDSSYAMGIDYGAITPLLLQAIKEQQDMIEKVKNENNRLKTDLQSLSERMTAIETILLTSNNEE